MNEYVYKISIYILNIFPFMLASVYSRSLAGTSGRNLAITIKKINYFHQSTRFVP